MEGEKPQCTLVPSNHAHVLPLHRGGKPGRDRTTRGPIDTVVCAPESCTRPPASHGLLTVICGCMFSGKTTDLLRRLDGCSPGSLLAFKHVIDNRYRGDAIVSHGGKAFPAEAITHAGEMLGCLCGGIELVAVDEGHFFDESLVDASRRVIGRGISVIITSLDRDSWGRRFPVAEQLRAIADEPIVRHAVCARCGATADRTQRLTPIIDGNMVGGPESYEPRCQRCWAPPPQPPPK